VTLYLLPHTPVKENVTRKGNRKRVPARWIRRLRLTTLQKQQHCQNKAPKTLKRQHFLYQALAPNGAA
jgi:hypothetical protein